ncbi:Enoyl-CoA hydratase/carnithine racemase [Nocardioides alpinus]|uniref:Enoyl-CoA hydratase n=1 Tax=Nocardioides alpinus TaxID=748909 RepID=A0A1I1A8Q7_9ACTN|nr:enoyl-CoA hydratase-related protein [Nocardioides alpinus]PKH42107.1 enoyl-CoA hydratase [Nocardioides alpinus]SFB32803.1 Enoyl-CoA hydratase/carnithine racemase [Nocardioides alpinus]
MSDHLVVERRDAVATVILNRPDSHNAINVAMYGDLPDVVRALDADPTVKVIVMRGAGTRSFASGADISEFEAERSDAVKAKAYNEKVAAAEHAIEELTKPSIAMIHGYCIGGGAGLALACDIRFADRAAKFAITPAKLGLVYSLESSKRMVDLVGPSRTKWILYSGLQVPAERAYELGLFDEVVDADDLEELTYGFADTVCSRAQFSVRAGKVMVDKVVAGQVRDDDATIDLRNSSFDTEDFTEGVQAFMAKRSPNFTWS